MKEVMAWIMGIGGLIAFVVGLVLGIWWLIWSLWSWVLPQIWPTGPQAIVAPSYWLFVGLWVLLGLVGSVFRSNK